MRSVIAIVLLAVSTISLAWGIAEQALFGDPQTIDVVVETDGTASAIVIHGKDLAAYPGRQTITVQGGVTAQVGAEAGSGEQVRSSDQVVAVYGRTVDVLAWINPARHTQIRYDPASMTFFALPRGGVEQALPNPLGSDLWLQEYVEAGELSFTSSIPEDVSVAIFTDGVLPAPTVVTISWPLVTATPLTTAAIVVGILSLVAGLFLLATQYFSWRKKRGPRRKLTRRPRPKRISPRSSRPTSLPERGRRRMGRVALPLGLAVALGVTGCQAPTEQVSAESSQAPAGELQVQAPYPAVTEVQFSRIMATIAETIQRADEELSVTVLGERVGDPTLEARRASYIIRRADQQSGTLLPITASPIRLVLPQQSEGWPRSVFGIIQDEQDVESPSFGVVLRQETPRSPYVLTYAIVLAPEVQLPDLPSARVGSATLSPDSKIIRLSPQDVVANYATLINEGPESAFAREFSLATDGLYAAIGPDAEALRQESFGESVEVQWVTSPGEVPPTAFSTADGGALVMGVLSEIETVKPRQGGAAVNASVAVRALTSLPQSVRGFTVESQIQVLWYVPPVGSDEGIRVLGYTYSLVGAREIDGE